MPRRDAPKTIDDAQRELERLRREIEHSRDECDRLRDENEIQIAGVEAGVLVQLEPEERRHFDHHGRRYCERKGDDGVRSSPPWWVPGTGGADDELLPEAIRVLARELPREGVEVAHALHRHQERFVRGEPRADQDRDLLAQVIFELRDVKRPRFQGMGPGPGIS